MDASIAVSSWTIQIFQVWMSKITFVNVLFPLAVLTNGVLSRRIPLRFDPPAPSKGHWSVQNYIYLVKLPKF